MLVGYRQHQVGVNCVGDYQDLYPMFIRAKIVVYGNETSDRKARAVQRTSQRIVRQSPDERSGGLAGESLFSSNLLSSLAGVDIVRVRLQEQVTPWRGRIFPNVKSCPTLGPQNRR